MMKSAENIRRYIKSAALDINPDAHQQIFEKILHARYKTSDSNDAAIQRFNWSLIMKSKAGKIAAVIAITPTLVFGTLFLLLADNTAWALTDSIDALRQFRAVVFVGTELDSETGQMKAIKLWCVESEDQSHIAKERYDVDGVCVRVANGDRTWRYDSDTHTVTKNLPYSMSEHGFGHQFLEQLHASHKAGFFKEWQVKQLVDASTGKHRMVLKIAWTNEKYNGPRSLRLEFDVESKLLVHVQQWENATWQGPARVTANRITYHKSLPENLFEFEIPEGATVIEH